MAWGEGLHHNSIGEVVDKNGYNAEGTYVGGEYREDEPSRNTYKNRAGSGSFSSPGIITSFIVVCVGVLIYKLFIFVTENWIPVVTILGICAACVISCLILRKKATKPGVKILCIILAGVGLIGSSAGRKTLPAFKLLYL